MLIAMVVGGAADRHPTGSNSAEVCHVNAGAVISRDGRMADRDKCLQGTVNALFKAPVEKKDSEGCQW